MAAAPLPTYLASSRQLGGIFPFLTGNGLPPTGAAIGQDMLTGGAFCFDPVAWTRADPLITSNPNLITFGKPGTGKSATFKLAVLRMMRFGVKTLLAGDIKGEYNRLCEAVGCPAIEVGPGLPGRVNALDAVPLGQGLDRLDREELVERHALIFERWTTLLVALLGAEDVAVTPSDRAVLTTVLQHLTGHSVGASELTPVTIPLVWQALRSPSPELVRECRYRTSPEMIAQTRTITDALQNLVLGPLSRLFDAPTTINIDWNAPIQSLSLQRLSAVGDRTVGIALTCLNSWSSSMLFTRDPGRVTIIGRDESWRQMRLGPAAVMSLDADLRLSRSLGQIQWLMAHKPSDMEGVGAAGSQAVAIARDFMSLCDTKVLFGQDANIADELAEALGLNELQRSWLTGWARQKKGRALWLVGDRVCKVESLATRAELALIETNEAMTA